VNEPSSLAQRIREEAEELRTYYNLPGYSSRLCTLADEVEQRLQAGEDALFLWQDRYGEMQKERDKWRALAGEKP